MKLESLKEIEYLYNNMTTCETIRLKPHLEAIENELLKLLPEYEENTNKLKALEIIKEKNVDVGAIKICVNAYAYNDFKELTETKLIKREKLTQEEFELVKEVLL